MADTDMRFLVKRWLKEGRLKPSGEWSHPSIGYGRLLYGEIDGFAIHARTLVQTRGEAICNDVRVRAS